MEPKDNQMFYRVEQVPTRDLRRIAISAVGALESNGIELTPQNIKGAFARAEGYLLHMLGYAGEDNVRIIPVRVSDRQVTEYVDLDGTRRCYEV